MSLETVGLVVALLTGVWGAVLSTILAILGRRDRRADTRRELRVEIQPAFDIQAREWMVTIAVANPSFQPVSVVGLSIELENGNTIAFPSPRTDRPLPAKLPPGEKLTHRIGLTQLADSLEEAGYWGEAKVRGVCLDALRGRHRSEPMVVHIETARELAAAGADLRH